MQLIDPQEYITNRQTPEGTMIYGGVTVDPSRGQEIAFFIRENLDRIFSWGRGPRVEIRLGLFWRGTIALVPLLIQVGPERDTELYETWINLAEPYNRELVERLTTQDRHLVLLYSHRRRERSLSMANILKDVYRTALERTSAGAWKMQEFDAARDAIYGEYPNPDTLWEAMSTAG